MRKFLQLAFREIIEVIDVNGLEFETVERSIELILQEEGMHAMVVDDFTGSYPRWQFLEHIAGLAAD